MTAQLSRERLEEIRDYDTCVTLEESAEMARMLLAGMDSEPVAVPDERAAFEAFMSGRFGSTIDRSRVKNGDGEYMAWDMQVAWIVWQRRAAMLNAGPVTAATWIDEAKKLAEMYGTSFVVFRNGEEPQCADPTKVVISFTDKGLGYPAAPEQEV